MGPSDSTPENQVRGQSFRSVLGACEEVLGTGGRTRVLAALPQDIREAYLYGAIVSGGWYPIEWYVDVLRAIRTQGPTVPHVGRQVGRISAQEDIRGVYKFILRLTTPSFVLAQLGRIIGTFFRQSDFDIVERKPRFVQLEVTIPGASTDLWEDFAGAAEAILVIAGAEEAEIAVRPKTQTSSATVIVKWKGENT